MNDARGERNRQLLEASAALLAADYPVDELIERLCETVSAAMHATAYVALPSGDDTVRVCTVAASGLRRHAQDQLMPEGCRVATVLHTGRSTTVRDASPHDEDPYDLRSHDGDARMRSAAYVPISHGESVLGVLAVTHHEAGEFTRDDVRLLDSLARHLAIAIRNQRSLSMVRTPVRYPWLAVAGAGAFVAAGTAAAVVLTNGQIDDPHERAQLLAGLFVVGAVWAVGIVLVAIVHLIYGARRAASGLKMQRDELQSEIATRLDAEEQLRAAAYHDALTGLPNRAFFLNQLGDVLDQRSLNAGVEYAVLFVDLDRFYVVNDSFGHGVGDQLLAAIAFRLEETIPPHALIARMGGDEFVLLLPSQGPALDEAIAIAEDILEALRNPFSIAEREVYSGASIGIVSVEDSYTDSETILRDADIAMYYAKRSGRARYAVFDHAMRRRVTQQLELEGSLRGAVDRGEIVAYYQPIVRVRDEAIVGFEALARWYRSGQSDVVAAGDFIPVAELTGMMRAIDAELFAQVCRDVLELSAIAPGIRVSVNVSANDLTRASLLPDIDSTLQRFSVSPSAFRIEITETAVMEDAERALAMLAELRARNLEIVVDDFGAGYSSLSYLQRLPLAGVKIDRSFIVALPGNGQALEIVRAIVALSKALGLHVTAEGVEREDQLLLLRELGVDYAQGFWFSPPVDFQSAKSFFAVAS